MVQVKGRDRVMRNFKKQKKRVALEDLLNSSYKPQIRLEASNSGTVVLYIENLSSAAFNCGNIFITLCVGPDKITMNDNQRIITLKNNAFHTYDDKCVEDDEDYSEEELSLIYLKEAKQIAFDCSEEGYSPEEISEYLFETGYMTSSSTISEWLREK
jgi:hypothetical protein